MKDCFGTIYPDLEKIQFGKPLAGKVFQICVASQGPGHRDRKLGVDLEAWQQCRQCQDFANCRDFSSAKLEMQRLLLDL
jgi:hypothetical protein